MKPKTKGNIQRDQQLSHVQEGPNWVLIAGGALLSTLSIRIGWRVKQAFDAKRSNNAHNGLKENGKHIHQRKSGTCELHSNIFCFSEDEEECYHCLPGNLHVATDSKHTPTSPTSKDENNILPLVKIPSLESNKDINGAIWVPSPDPLELSQKPFHRSNSCDSPCLSESGSDIYSRREVIQKLRQQLKMRDEMIMEMQAQITDLRNAFTAEMSRSVHLQSRLDLANRDLFDSEREIQRLRKAIADHCVAEAVASKRPVDLVHTNGYTGSMDDVGAKLKDLQLRPS